VPLGKTGLVISDIGFGSSGCPSADVVRHCYDRGMTYFDTAEMYGSEGWGKGEFVESFVGEALHDKRDKVVITTKYLAERTIERSSCPNSRRACGACAPITLTSSSTTRSTISTA
jgi:aryl-alcohol dehydrogenase-like predicted oxidoreductase